MNGYNICKLHKIFYYWKCKILNINSDCPGLKIKLNWEVYHLSLSFLIVYFNLENCNIAILVTYLKCTFVIIIIYVVNKFRVILSIIVVRINKTFMYLQKFCYNHKSRKLSNVGKITNGLFGR